MNRLTWPRATAIAFAALAIATGSPARAQPQTQAPAQEWRPDGVVKIIAPVGAGTASDTVARFYAEALSREWKVPVIVENKVGANQMIGADAVAKAAPDGKTLLMVSSPHYINKSIYKNMAFDPVKDFTAIAGFSTACQVLVVKADAPYKTLKDLLAAARAKPDSLNYSTSGTGSVTHLAAAVMLSDAKVSAVHVPYKGGDGAITDVVGGQVTFMFAPLTSAVPLIQAGKLRALAVSAARRVPSLPDTPTVAEAGLPGYEVVTRFGVLGPARIEPARVDALSKAVVKIAQSPEFQAFAPPRGFFVDTANHSQYAATRQAELDQWARIVAISGAKQE
jgi:tripartite-type tricarboxylate transporter receptor subunit TctC